jgi:DNA-binding response OmpR family regulator
MNDILIAYYTALSRVDIENEIKSTGADDYVPKGLPLEELKKKVSVILNRV